MRLQSGVRRSCQRRTFGSGDRPCSTKSSRPLGLRTRRISDSARVTPGIVQRVHAVTTVSTLLSSRFRGKYRRRKAEVIESIMHEHNALRPLIEQTFEDFHQLPLLIGRESTQAVGWFGDE